MKHLVIEAITTDLRGNPSLAFSSLDDKELEVGTSGLHAIGYLPISSHDAQVVQRLLDQLAGKEPMTAEEGAAPGAPFGGTRKRTGGIPVAG